MPGRAAILSAESSNAQNLVWSYIGDAPDNEGATVRGALFPSEHVPLRINGILLSFDTPRLSWLQNPFGLGWIDEHVAHCRHEGGFLPLKIYCALPLDQPAFGLSAIDNINGESSRCWWAGALALGLNLYRLNEEPWAVRGRKFVASQFEGFKCDFCLLVRRIPERERKPSYSDSGECCDGWTKPVSSFDDLPQNDKSKIAAGAIAVLLAMGLVAYIAIDSEDRRRDSEKDEGDEDTHQKGGRPMNPKSFFSIL